MLRNFTSVDHHSPEKSFHNGTHQYADDVYQASPLNLAYVVEEDLISKNLQWNVVAADWRTLAAMLYIAISLEIHLLSESESIIGLDTDSDPH